MTGTAVLDEITQYEDRLSQPVLALYEYLTEGETDTTPEELRDEVDDEPAIHDVEYIAYAGLLEALQEQDEEQQGVDFRLLTSYSGNSTETFTVDY